MSIEQTVAVLGLFVTVLGLAIAATWRMASMAGRIENNADDIRRHGRTQQMLFDKVDEIWKFIRKQNGGH